MIKIHYQAFYCIKRLFKIYLSLSSDLLLSKFIHHYHYQYHYQILMLIPHQYSSQFLSFLAHIYILLKMFGDDTFHMHKEQNLELLLINIYVVFFLLVPFQALFYYKNLKLYCLHMFLFLFLCIYHHHHKQVCC